MSAVATAAGGATVRWRALGTSALLRSTDPASAQDAHLSALAELDAIDRACSRFRADSDLTRVNEAGGRAVSVSPLLLDALDVALRAQELTAGAVDPCLGRELELAGYDRDWELIAREGLGDDGCAGGAAASPSVKLTARRRRPARAVELDRDAGTVRLARGMKLDLGATAKAWAADRAAAAAARSTGAGVLVSLGGDIASAGEAPSAGWRIHVTDDHRSGPDAPGQTVAIQEGGLATSSVTVRRWRRTGATMHHIIDPATGAPARSAWRTASVAAESCTDANIASTTAILLSEDAPAWLARAGLPARLVAVDGSVLQVGAWPEAA